MWSLVAQLGSGSTHLSPSFICPPRPCSCPLYPESFLLRGQASGAGEAEAPTPILRRTEVLQGRSVTGCEGFTSNLLLISVNFLGTILIKKK